MKDLPLAVFSIEFVNSIVLHDVATDAPSNPAPQWLLDTHSRTIAYQRGQIVRLRVVFLQLNTNAYRKPVELVYARGGCGVKPCEVALQFDQYGLSDPTDFEIEQVLPNHIGLHTYTFDWFAQVDETSLFIGSTTHTICTTLKPVILNDADKLETWVYEPVMRWSCVWAQGQETPKAVCDALIRNLDRSGLSYGLDGCYTLRGLLLRGSGMCGAWYRFFQQLAHCQGVYVARRDMTIVRITWLDQQTLWDGVVVTKGGINCTTPAVEPHQFFDNNQQFPICSKPVKIKVCEERRYVFEGESQHDVGKLSSTHALNFFHDDDGQVYLYDPSFQLGPLFMGTHIPHLMSFMHGSTLKHFKKIYLDEAFPYLMGSIYNGNTFYETMWESTPADTTYGMLVATALVSPEVITIGWSQNGK